MLRSSREAVNTIFEVIGLTQLRIKPETTVQETDALPLGYLSYTDIIGLPLDHLIHSAI